MINYFKYTDGNAFTLSGQDYKGMFNIKDGIITSGGILTSNSQALSSKGNFLSRVYSKEFNFNVTKDDVVTIDKPKVYPRTILTMTYLLDVARRLNANNLLLYSKMITYNSNLLNTITKTPAETSIVFCLTSASTSDPLTGLKMPIDAGVRFPFSQNPNSSYYVPFRDDILLSNAAATFIVTQPNEDFKYYTSNYVLSGAFNQTSRQAILTSTLTPGVSSNGLVYNKYENLLYNISKTNNNYSIYSFYSSTSCLTASFFDRVDTTKYNTTNNDKSQVSFGKRYRSAVVYDQGLQILEISKVNTSLQLLSILPADLGFELFFSISQRFEDDAIAIYGISGGQAVLNVYDISELLLGSLNAYTSSIVENSSSLDIITFSPFDSDIIIFTRYASEGAVEDLAWRSISNASYPILKINGNQPLGFIGSTKLQGMPALSAIYRNVENVHIELGISDEMPHYIYDVKFDVTNNISSIIFYRDSYETYSTSNVFSSIVPLDLPYCFNENFIPADSSIGIAFNDYIKSIIKDTYSLYNAAASRFVYNNEFVISTTLPYGLPNLPDTYLRVYENESFNVGVLNRIIEGITEIQDTIATTIVV